MAVDFWKVADHIGRAPANRILSFVCYKTCSRFIYRQQNEQNHFAHSRQRHFLLDSSPATPWFPKLFSVSSQQPQPTT